MTAREKLLITILGAVSVLAVGLTTATFWMDDASRLDTEYQGYRLAATRALSQTLAGTDTVKTRSVEQLQTLFWEKGKAPSVLVFSTQIRNAAQRAGLPISGFRVIEESEGKAWVQLQAQAAIGPWFAFIKTLAQDSRVLYRRALIKKGEGDLYSYTCEVGYATLP